MASHSVEPGSMTLDADAVVAVERLAKRTSVGIAASHTKWSHVRHAWNHASNLRYNDLWLHGLGHDNLRSLLDYDWRWLLVNDLGLLVNNLRLLLVNHLRLLLVHNLGLLLILRLLDILRLLLVLNGLLHWRLLAIAHRHLLLRILWLGILLLLLLGILRLLLGILIVHLNNT